MIEGLNVAEENDDFMDVFKAEFKKIMSEVDDDELLTIMDCHF